MSPETSEMSSGSKFRELSKHYDCLEHLNKQLRTCLKNRYSYEEQIAEYGFDGVPVRLIARLEKTLSEIETLQVNIKQEERSISEIKQSIIVEEKEKEKLSKREVRTLLSNFWQIRDGEPLLCAVSTLGHSKTLKYKRPMTGFGEILGYASILYSLARAYETNVTKDAMLYFSNVFPMNVQLESSLVLLGGDDRNKVLAEIFEQFQRTGCKLPFRFEYELQQDKETGEEKETGIKNLICEDEEGNEEKYEPLMEKGRVVEDFGVVARLPNPFNPRHSKVFIFAGCHTYGTAAAAKVVAAKSILRRIEETCPYYRKGKFFVAAIHAYVVGYYFFHIDRMVIFYLLDEESLKPIPRSTVRNVTFHGAPLDH